MNLKHGWKKRIVALLTERDKVGGACSAPTACYPIFFLSHPLA